MFSVTIEVNKYWNTGNYYIGSVELRDNRDNEIRLVNSTLANNPYSTPYFFVNNTGIAIPVVETIEYSNNQGYTLDNTNVMIKFDLADFEYQGGEMSLGYYHNNFQYIFTTFSFFENEFDMSTGLLEIDLSNHQENLPIENGDIYITVYRISLYFGNNQLDFIHDQNYTSDKFLLLFEDLNESISIKINPPTDKGIVNKEIDFVLDISSNSTRNFWNVEISLEIRNSFHSDLKVETVDILSLQSISQIFSLIIPTTGNYSLIARLHTPQVVETQIGYEIFAEATTDPPQYTSDPNPTPTLELSVMSVISTLGIILISMFMRKIYK